MDFTLENASETPLNLAPFGSARVIDTTHAQGQARGCASIALSRADQQLRVIVAKPFDHHIKEPSVVSPLFQAHARIQSQKGAVFPAQTRGNGPRSIFGLEILPP